MEIKEMPIRQSNAVGQKLMELQGKAVEVFVTTSGDAVAIREKGQAEGVCIGVNGEEWKLIEGFAKILFS